MNGSPASVQLASNSLNLSIAGRNSDSRGELLLTEMGQKFHDILASEEQASSAAPVSREREAESRRSESRQAADEASAAASVENKRQLERQQEKRDAAARERSDSREQAADSKQAVEAEVTNSDARGSTATTASQEQQAGDNPASVVEQEDESEAADKSANASADSAAAPDKPAEPEAGFEDDDVESDVALAAAEVATVVESELTDDFIQALQAVIAGEPVNPLTGGSSGEAALTAALQEITESMAAGDPRSLQITNTTTAATAVAQGSLNSLAAAGVLNPTTAAQAGSVAVQTGALAESLTGKPVQGAAAWARQFGPGQGAAHQAVAPATGIAETPPLTAESLMQDEALLAKLVAPEGAGELAQVSAESAGKASLSSGVAQMSLGKLDLLAASGSAQADEKAAIRELSAGKLDVSSLQAVESKTVTANLSQYQQAANRAAAMQTAVQVPVGQPRWSEAVGEKVLWMAAQNVSSAEIRLDPPELGQLQVRVTVSQDQVSVSFASQHAVVREALDLGALRLREMFESQDLDLVDVDVSDQSLAQEFDRDQSGGEGGQAGDMAEGEQPEEVAVTALDSAAGLVDHYV